MGYYSTVKGKISFTPPVTYSEVKSSGFVITDKGQNYIDKDVELESFGPASRPDDEIDCIIASSEDAYKVYEIVDDLKELVTLLGPGRTYNGYLQIEGEGDGSGEPDIWRLRVKDGKVEEVRPKLVWPED